jgi:hypothetical protein
MLGYLETLSVGRTHLPSRNSGPILRWIDVPGDPSHCRTSNNTSQRNIRSLVNNLDSVRVHANIEADAGGIVRAKVSVGSTEAVD